MDALRQPFIIFAILVTIGAALLTGMDRPKDPTPIQSWLGEDRKEAVLRGQVVDGPHGAPRGWSLVVAIESLDDGPGLAAAGAKIRLFYPTEVAGLDAERRRLPLPGDRIEVFARHERFPPPDLPGSRLRTTMENRGLESRATAREPVEILGSEPGLGLAIERHLTLRRLRLEHALYRTLNDDAFAVAAAMLTASRGWMTAPFREPFDRTGTSHLLAISGLHLGVLGALLWWVFGLIVNRVPWLLRRYGRRRASALFVVLTLTSYVMMIGAPTSARRALIMVIVAVTAYALMRSFCSLHALATAALVLIASQPSIVHEVGFQLSFAATLGILLFWRGRPAALRPADVPAPESRPERLRRRILSFIGVSTSATVATWPVLWPMTGEIGLNAIVLNWIVVPLVSLIIFPVLLAGALTIELVPSLGAPLLEAASAAMVLIQRGLDQVAYLPFTGLTPGSPGLWLWACSTLAIAQVVAFGYRPEALATAAVLVVFGCTSLFFASSEPTLRVHFIPVGQGDATLVEFPDGTTLLVDAGGRSVGADPGLTVVAPYLRRQGITRLDWIILTHAHHDHMGGMQALVRPFRPRNFVFDAAETDRDLAELTRSMAEAGAVLHPLDGRLCVAIKDVKVDVLRPDAVFQGSKNDMSLVTYVRYGPASLFLPGDIEAETEAWLLAGFVEPATIVKMPHHGSRTSSTPALIDALRPVLAVASAGHHNHFGHPHQEVLARYEASGAETLRTDRHGLIVVEINGDGRIVVETKRAAQVTPAPSRSIINARMLRTTTRR